MRKNYAQRGYGSLTADSCPKVEGERAKAPQRKAAAPFDAAASYSQQVELD
jgi:hypothetical protein